MDFAGRRLARNLPGICPEFAREFESDARSRFEAGFTGASPGLTEVAHANSLKLLLLLLLLRKFKKLFENHKPETV